QFGEIQRIGSDNIVHARARVISASNRDLQSQVRRREFREDLYYRINVFRIHTPPLREHPEDIPALVNHFCRKLAVELNRESVQPEPELMEKLLEYSYPGNVRELENILLRAVAMSTGSVLTIKDLPPEMLESSSPTTPWQSPRTGEELESMKKIATRKATEQLEEAFVKFALTQGNGNVSESARRTAIERTRLQKLIRRHGIDSKSFKL
ncbi:MAG: sigma 54-interacting transcriptional regulator, partial [Planctomycetota bacterium]|nr:sigma 54-interacting transcriptional regulator [Planctomycetota bacterium]